MGREELKLKVLNGTARLIAQQAKPAADDIRLLVRGVMDHMLETGTDLLHFDNLYVQVSFEEAVVMSFLVDDGAGRILDLEKYTGDFSLRLVSNKNSGLRRLVTDLSSDDAGRFTKLLHGMVFSKN